MVDYEYTFVSTWKPRGINFWGIPKCGSTSIKAALIGNGVSNEIIEECKSGLRRAIPRMTLAMLKSDLWVHSSKVCTYVDRETAMNNGLTNFTVIRDPISRLISFFEYHKRSGPIEFYTIDMLMDRIESIGPDITFDSHYSTQYSRIVVDGKLIPIVFKLETIKPLEDFLGVHIKTLNSSPNKTNKLTAKQLTRAESIFQKDFELYESI